jgi:hypothetical protein
MINIFKFSIEKIIDINKNTNKNTKKLKNKIKLINTKIDNILKNILENKIDELKSNITNSQIHNDKLYNKLDDISYLNLSSKIQNTSTNLVDNYEFINNRASSTILQNTSPLNNLIDNYEFVNNRASSTILQNIGASNNLVDNYEFINNKSSSSILQNTLLELSTEQSYNN